VGRYGYFRGEKWLVKLGGIVRRAKMECFDIGTGTPGRITVNRHRL
jgi:hypothetical protein